MFPLATAMAPVSRELVGTVALGPFGYYATRPIAVRVRRVVDSRQFAAAVTVVTMLVPVGFFLMPILFVLVLEAVRIVLPELVRGEAIEATVAEGLGTNPEDARDAPATKADGSTVSRSESGPRATTTASPPTGPPRRRRRRADDGVSRGHTDSPSSASSRA